MQIELIRAIVISFLLWPLTLFAAEPQPPDYQKQISPIFTKYCNGCHDAKEANGELVLENFTRLMRGGENGPVIVPGKAETSRLILLLEKKSEPFMPPEGNKGPNQKEISVLKTWIKAGAKGPQAGTAPQPLVTPIIKLLGKARRPIYAVAYSPDGKLIAVARHGSVEIVSSPKHRLLATLTDHTGQVNDVGFSADGKTLFAAAGEPGLFGETTLWNTADWTRLRTIQGHRDSLYAADLNREGTILATGSYDQAIKLWDAKTGRELRTLSGHNGAVFDLAFHPSGKFLASASEDFTVKLWDVSSGGRLETLNQPTKAQYAVAFSSDGQYVAAGGGDYRIRLWRMSERGTARIAYSQFAHKAAILKLAFAPGDQLLFSSAEDQTIKLWETQGLRQIGALAQQSDWTAALTISPDGQTLVVGRLDGSLSSYPVNATGSAEADRPRPLTETDVTNALVTNTPTAKPVEVAEVEPNDFPNQATPLSIPATASGRLMSTAGQSEDFDLYRIEANKGQTWIVETSAARDKSSADTKIEILHADGRPVERLLLRAVRNSSITFRPIDSSQTQARVINWQEMELNQYLYMNGEVVKFFRAPRGPDSGFQFYSAGGKRRCYFDTSATAHALDESTYIVQPYLSGTKLTDNGLPVFTLYYANDDDGHRKLGLDSRLTFSVPADGTYLVRVSDVRGFGGKDFRYRLRVREPKPDFDVTIGGKDATLGVGSGQPISFQLDRKDNFRGEVRFEISNLPDGFSVSLPSIVEAGHLETRAVINAAADLVPSTKTGGTDKSSHPSQPTTVTPDWSKVSIVATAIINGKQVQKEVGNLGHIKVDERPKVIVSLRPDRPAEAVADEKAAALPELVIAPGQSITALLSIERHDFNGELKFDVDNLPHGVIVDNIGLSGIMIREGETRRQIFLTAADWVPETTRMIHAVSQGQGNQASQPIVLRVSRPGRLVKGEEK